MALHLWDNPLLDTDVRLKTAIAEIERLRARAEVYAAERDHAIACYEHTVRLLTDIHALLYPPRFTGNDGRTWQFKSPLAGEQMQELSDRIRALPDEIAKAPKPGEKA